MHINIKATGIELTPAIFDYTTKKVSALEKYLDKGNPDIVAQVEVGKISQHHKSGEVFRAEVHIVGGGNDYYAVSEQTDLYAAVDLVKDEIAREMVKTKGKRFAMAKRGGRALKNAVRGFPSALKRIRFKR